MGAVPKKKLCWNCEGNVAKDIDNCPYCGVYLNGTEPEDSHFWGPTYRPSTNEDFNTIPSPLYQAAHLEKEANPSSSIDEDESKTSSNFLSSFQELKQDVLPILLLMSGSVFLLFGLILFLFSDNSILTLQWNGDRWVYFLGLSVPFLYWGWKFLQQIDTVEK